MAGIHITDIESAINYWRDKKPSPDGFSLEPEIRALAEVYALMVFYHEVEADEFSFPKDAYAAWLAWYHSTPDTPCIAICSTSQGDDVCKGCGRSFVEVQHWVDMSRLKNARPGGASPWKTLPGGLTGTPSARPRARRSGRPAIQRINRVDNGKPHTIIIIANYLYRTWENALFFSIFRRECLFPAHRLNIYCVAAVTQHQHAFLNRCL